MDQSQMLLAAVAALGSAILVMWRVDQAKSARALAASEDARTKADERWRKEQRDVSVSLMEINDRVVAALERNNMLISRLLASPCIRGDHATAELAPPSPVHGWAADPQPHDLPTPIPSVRPISGDRRRVGAVHVWMLAILAALAVFGCAGPDIARAEANAAQARQESAAIAAAVAQVDATNRELLRVLEDGHTNHTKVPAANSPDPSVELPMLTRSVSSTSAGIAESPREYARSTWPERAAAAQAKAEVAVASVAAAVAKNESASSWADLILAALAGAAGLFLPAAVPFIRMVRVAKHAQLAIATTAIHADRMEEQVYHALDSVDGEEDKADIRSALSIAKQIAAGEQAGMGVRKIIQAARGKPV